MRAKSAEQCDVVVVGGGGSGLAAAIEAATAGSRTILLEKKRALGGSTAWSVGSVTASVTSHQRRAGIADRPEWHWEDMGLFPQADDERDNVELRRILCEEMPATFAWLQVLGIRFFGPVAEPPHRVPRMHTVLPNSNSFIHHLQKRARQLGVDIRLCAKVESLLVEDDAVIGLQYRTEERAHRLRAGAVILSAGDFTSDPVYKRRFMGAQAAAVPGVNFAATGDGQRLAESIGGVILNGELALGPELRFQAPSSRPLAARLPPWTLIGDFLSWSMGNLPGKMLRPLIMKFLTTTLAPSKSLFAEGALLVDRGGRALDTHGADPAISVSNTAENEAFIIVDIGVWKRFNQWPHYVSTAPGIAYAYMDDYVRNRKDICHRGDTIEALAKSIGANAATLVQTMQSRQEMPCEGPYWALGPVKSVFVHTEGGLSVDCAHRVLRSSKDPIAGLYASGSTGQGGLLLRGHGHHLAWAFVSGRRAGRNASEWAKKYSAVQAVAAALVS